MLVALDLLPNTRTLYPQAMLDPVPYPLLGALVCERQQLLNAVITRQLDELCLPPQRVDRIVPFARHRVFCRPERVGGFDLVGGLRGLGRCLDRGRGVSGEEA